MRKVILVLIMVLASVAIASAQVFSNGFNTDFESVSIQIDPLGSVDKEGLNSVVSFSAVDFDWLEWEVQCQTVFTSKYSDTGSFQLDYLDFQFGPGVMVPIGDYMSLTGGFHLGFLYRAKNNVRMNDAGGIIYGPTGKFRLKITEGINFVVSSAYDRRPELGKWVINGRGGLEFIL